MIKLVKQTLLIALITLAGFEFVLQLGTWVMTSVGLHKNNNQFVTNNVRVLAVGDSNTYGMYLPANESYPAQLEALWNQQNKPKLEILNLGYPGSPSNKLVSMLPALLEKLQPDILLVKVGVNDILFPSMPAEITDISPLQKYKIWLDNHSRVMRLFNIFRRSRLSSQDIDMGERLVLDWKTTEERNAAIFDWKIKRNILGSDKDESLLHFKLGDKSVALLGEPVRVGDQTLFLLDRSTKNATVSTLPQLENNLTTIKKYCVDRGIKMLLVSYAASEESYAGANNAISHFAQSAQVPFVDMRKTFKSLCPDQVHCAEYFFPDLHPTAKGYHVEALAVMDSLKQLL